MLSDYWPEEGTPDFVSHDDGQTWTPLCCSTEMTPHRTTMSNWRCDECGTLHLIWAEDWPDYEEEEDEDTTESDAHLTAQITADHHDTWGAPASWDH